MKIFTGFVFTEGPIRDLERKGFSFSKDESDLNRGYRSFRAALSDSVQMEIREILDEKLYLQSYQVEHFEPHMISMDGPVKKAVHANTVSGFESSVTASLLKPGELRTYFEIRKPFPLWALELTCGDFSKFCQVARPDRIFQLQGCAKALIHMGPNCFDFLVREEK